MSDTFDEREFQGRLQQLDALLRAAETQADPAAAARLQKVVHAILDLYGAGLGRILEHMDAAGEAGMRIIDACGRDPVVAGLLHLHGLHPLGIEERVQEALESVRPYLKQHGGNVELIEVREGEVRLRLEGSCHHCPSSSLTMQQRVEEAIYGQAPEVTRIVVEGMAEEAVAAESEEARFALPLVV